MERFWVGAWGHGFRLRGGVSGGWWWPGKAGRDWGAGLGGLGHLGDSTLRTEWGEKCWRVLEEEIKLACDGDRSAPRVACVRVDGVRPCPAHHHTVLGNPPKPAAPSSDRHSLPLR